MPCRDMLALRPWTLGGLLITVLGAERTLKVLWGS